MKIIPESILHLVEQASKVVRAGGNTRPYFDKLIEELTAQKTIRFEKDAIQALIHKDKLSGQILVRHLRELNAFKFDEVSNLECLYFGLPLVIPHSKIISEECLIQANTILSNWISSEGLIEGSATLADAPLLEGCANVSDCPFLDNWSYANFEKQMKRGDNTLFAGVWPGAITSSPASLSYIQSKLKKMQAFAPDFVRIKKQIESLMADAGTPLLLFPPSSWANVESLSRIARFRFQLQIALRENSLKKEWTFTLKEDDTLVEISEGGDISWGTFPEETREDIIALLASAARSHNVRLQLL